MPHRAAIFTLTTSMLLVCGSSTFAQALTTIPGRDGQVMLIRNTLTAVSHGNITGNYSVLRDLSSDAFKNRNKPADLAVTFAKLRAAKFDLSPVLIVEPQLTQQPGLDQANRLVLVGYVATQPQQVRFGLMFQQVGGGWVIDGVSVGVVPEQTTQVPAPHSLQQQPAQRQPAPRQHLPAPPDTVRVTRLPGTQR